MEIHKILIPVDFSESCSAIFKFLETLPEAHRSKLEITLLHYLEFPMVPGNFLTPVDYLGDLYQEHLKTFGKELEKMAEREEFKGLRVKTEMIGTPGSAVGETVAEYAETHSIDLVLLVSKHRKGLGNIFPGSELRRILRYCHVPMIVFSPGEVRPIRRIAYATDFSEQSAAFFKKLQHIAEFIAAEIQCFRVVTVNEFMSEREFNTAKAEFIAALGFTHIPEINSWLAWQTDDGILTYAEDHLANAVALATHGYKGVSRLFNASVTERIIAETTYPVIVFNFSKN